jgi:hypothetical protein
MVLPAQLQHLRDHSSMHVQPVTYSSIVACIHGYDLATDFEFLRGFREWLRTIAPRGFNMSWDGLVLYCAFPDSINVREKLLDPHNERTAIKKLFELLSEFIGIRTEVGLEQIFRKHQEWESKQRESGWQD